MLPVSLDKLSAGLQLVLAAAGVAAAFFFWLPWGVAGVGILMAAVLVVLVSRKFHFQALDLNKLSEPDRIEAANQRDLLEGTRRAASVLCPLIFLSVLILAAAWKNGPDILAYQANEFVRDEIYGRPDRVVVDYVSGPAQDIKRAPASESDRLLVVAPAPSRDIMQRSREVRALEFGYVISKTIGDPATIFGGLSILLFLVTLILTFFVWWMDKALIRRHVVSK